MADAPDRKGTGLPSQQEPPAAAGGSERPQRIVVLRDFCLRAHGADCERCALACPQGAVSFAEDGIPAIDEDACTRCGICLGVCDASWLPGFNADSVSWGIWFVYAGLLLGLCTTTYYVLAGYRKMQKAKRLEAKGRL